MVNPLCAIDDDLVGLGMTAMKPVKELHADIAAIASDLAKERDAQAEEISLLKNRINTLSNDLMFCRGELNHAEHLLAAVNAERDALFRTLSVILQSLKDAVVVQEHSIEMAMAEYQRATKSLGDDLAGSTEPTTAAIGKEIGELLAQSQGNGDGTSQK